MTDRHTLDHGACDIFIRTHESGRAALPRLREPHAMRLASTHAKPVCPYHSKAGHQPMSYSSTHVSVIIGVREQDPKRWRQFNDLYRPMLMDYLRRRNLPEFDAEDVVQDVFVKLISKINTYDREKSCFRSWLFTVVNHSLIDAARRKAAHVKAQEGWVVNVLRSTPTESVMLEEAWRKLHQERILKHSLKGVRARVSPARGPASCSAFSTITLRPKLRTTWALGPTPSTSMPAAS